MQLTDFRCQLGGKLGNDWDLKAARGDHDTIAPQLSMRGRQPEAVAVSRQPGSPYAASHRKVEAVRIGLEVVGHFVVGGETADRNTPSRQT